MSDRRFWLGMTPILVWFAGTIGAALFALYAALFDWSLMWVAMVALVSVAAVVPILPMVVPLLLPHPEWKHFKRWP